jgi:hypothetical protein
VSGGNNRTVGGGITAGTRTAISGSDVQGSTTQMDAGSGTDAPRGTGQVSTTDRFIRENRGAGAFVGATAADVQDFVGAVQGGTGSNFRIQNLGSGMQRPGGVNQPGGGGRGRRATTIRTTLRVAFNHPMLAAGDVSTALSDRLTRLGKIRSSAGLTVEVREGTATLRGVVATRHDREMAEQLARLEAGVWSVKNELTIAQISVETGPAMPAAPGPATPPAGPTVEPPAKPPAP